MEENSPSENKDNNSNQNKNNYPARDNRQPISYAESYRRMNERRMREGEISRNTTPATHTNPSIHTSANTNANTNYKSHDSFMDNFTNTVKKGNASSVSGTSSKARAFESAAETENSRFAAKAGNVERGFSNIKKESVRVERRVENEGRKIFYEGERAIHSRPARRIEKWIIVAVYVIVILAAIYFILATFFPGKMPFSKNVYEIKASDSKIFTALDSFYIDDQSVLGDKVQIDNMTVRPIISSKKFNFVFAPKENIPEGENATFQLNLVLNSTNSSSIYVNEQLVFPDLTNYRLIKETETDYVYVNKEILNYTDFNSFKEASSTEDYIYQNLPGASVWATRKLDSVNVRLGDYKKENTLINGTFRGDLKLVVYVEGELNADFIKQDLNSYLGADEYNVTITDSSGNVVYDKLFEDDEDKTDSKKLGKEQFFEIKLDKLDKGLYYINFLTDLNNDYSDLLVKNIQINSNKILIVNNFLLLTSFKFYKLVNFPKQIGFYYWHSEKDQIINIIGNERKIINLSKEWFNKIYYENLTKGEYVIELKKGDLQIYNDVSSLNKKSWFNIPITPKREFDNPYVIVIDKVVFDKALGMFSYNSDVNMTKTPVKVSLRSLDSYSVSFKDVMLSLK